MSLAIVFKGTEGVVLAADSRVTLQIPISTPVPATGGTPVIYLIPATFDNATKLLKVAGQDHVAAVTYGIGAIGNPEPRTAHSLLPEFEATLTSSQRLPVQDFAKQMSDFFADQWNRTMPAGVPGDMVFVVGGFDPDAPYGRIFEFYIPNSPTPAERHANSFGIQWGGQQDITSRILNAHDPLTLELIKNKFKLTDTQTTGLADEIQQQSGARIPYQFFHSKIA